MDFMSFIKFDFLKGKPRKKDSKLRSALEVTLDVAIGCIIATIMNYTILPLYIDVIQSGEIFGMLQITAWYVIASYVRKYTIRRWFVNLKHASKKKATK